MPTTKNSFTFNKTDLLLNNGINADKLEMYLGESKDGESGTIGFDDTKTVWKGLSLLNSLCKNKNKRIKIFMNSFGGCAYNGLGIYDLIKNNEVEVEIVVIGSCFSMGAFILQAGKRRLLYPNSSLMIHHGTNGFEGNSIDMIKNAEEGKRVNNIYLNTLWEKIKESEMKMSKKELDAKLNNDWYLSAQAAIEYNLADEIVIKH